MNESISLGGRRVTGFSLCDGPGEATSQAPIILGGALAGAAIVGTATAGISYAATGKAHVGRALVAALFGAAGGGLLGAIPKRSAPETML